MSRATEPAFEVILPEPELTKFERERRAFYRLLPDLLRTHRGQYVAIHDEQIVDSGTVRLDVVFRAQANHPGGVYVELVSADLPQVVRSGIRCIA